MWNAFRRINGMFDVARQVGLGRIHGCFVGWIGETRSKEDVCTEYLPR
jgi:hypothetical protein